MTAYYKIVMDNIIDGFGTNGPDQFPDMHPISKEEYKMLLEMMANAPTEPVKEDYMYVLQDEPLAWVQIKCPDV